MQQYVHDIVQATTQARDITSNCSSLSISAGDTALTACALRGRCNLQCRPKRQSHRRQVDEGGKDAPLLKHFRNLLQGAHKEHSAAWHTDMACSRAGVLTTWQPHANKLECLNLRFACRPTWQWHRCWQKCTVLQTLWVKGRTLKPAGRLSRLNASWICLMAATRWSSKSITASCQV